jgi:adenylate cyclase
VETPVFVARERELQCLDRFLGAALAGEGQVCFVSGEAGSGKTALVTEFARRAEARHPELIAAFGQADAQTGIGDPYLPFREVLGLLTGDDASQRARTISPENASRLRRLVNVSARFLVQIAPDLVGLLVPGGGLAISAARATADMAGWLGKLEKLAQQPRPAAGLGGAGLDQNVVFGQYTRFVTSLAEEKPLLLILDDLQWADSSSIALLFRLGRRIGQSRVLIVGTYRPEEMARQGAGDRHPGDGRHPLEKVIAELKRYQGEIELSLDAADAADRQDFVDSLLDNEPNVLDEGFRAALLRRTDGQALFTVELLRAMQERGDLVCDAVGCWTPGPTLDWDALPARVEGVIEERIERLAVDLRAALTVASVEGEEFTAEVVAQVRAVEARELVRRLSEELQREHRLVRAEGLRRLEARRLALYRFEHNLFQKYLYNGVDAVERAYLHEDVGNALEALYREQTDQVAVQLARHFEEAGVADKAATYLRRAGELAAARYANEEALAYFGRALALLPAADREGRYQVLMARQRVHDLLEERDAQGRDLAELEKLAQGLSLQEQAEAAVWRARHTLYAGVSHAATTAAAQTAVECARAAGNAGLEAMGQLYWGLAFEGGEKSSGHLEEAAALARAAGLPNVEARALGSLAMLGRTKGDAATARSYEEQALALYRAAGNRRGEASTLIGLAFVQTDLGDYGEAWKGAERALALSLEIGARRTEKIALFVLGMLRYFMGDYQAGQGNWEEVLAMDRELADRFHEGIRLYVLGLLSRRQADYGRTKELEEQALHLARELGYGDLEGQALAALGDLYQELGDPAVAREYYKQALSVFRRLEMTEQRIFPALAGLAEATLALGEPAQAQACIAEILAYLAQHDKLRGTWDPFRIYLVCYRVLRANGDPRAASILAAGYRLLQEQAGRIPDEALRRSFLENVAENRELAAEFAAAQQPQ